MQPAQAAAAHSAVTRSLAQAAAVPEQKRMLASISELELQRGLRVQVCVRVEGGAHGSQLGEGVDELHLVVCSQQQQQQW